MTDRYKLSFRWGKLLPTSVDQFSIDNKNLSLFICSVMPSFWARMAIDNKNLSLLIRSVMANHGLGMRNVLEIIALPLTT